MNILRHLTSQISSVYLYFQRKVKERITVTYMYMILHFVVKKLIVVFNWKMAFFKEYRETIFVMFMTCKIFLF